MLKNQTEVLCLNAFNTDISSFVLIKDVKDQESLLLKLNVEKLKEVKVALPILFVEEEFLSSVYERALIEKLINYDVIKINHKYKKF